MTAAPDQIDALDLEVVRVKLTMPQEAGGYGWPERETNDAIRGYRAFLKQVRTHRRARANASSGGEAKAGHGPAPDPVTDIVWHTHILFTEKYHRDCAALFGEYIHHRPRIAEDDGADHHPVGS